jgi:hypothetical protein
VHRVLADFSRSPEARAIAKLPVLNGLASNLQDKTEDLNDLIENLVLADNEDFKVLISDCASSIGLLRG